MSSHSIQQKGPKEMMRSPSIPSEIGADNFTPYFLEDSGESSSASSRLGISKPSYGVPDANNMNTLDFSPILHSRKQMSRPKSALDKYTNKPKPSSTNFRSTDRVSVVKVHQNYPIPPPEQAIQSPVSSSRLFKQKKKKASKNFEEDKNNHIHDDESTQASSRKGNKNTAPFRNPIKALKLSAAKSPKVKHSKSSRRNLMVQNQKGSCSSMSVDNDGSIDMYSPLPPQVERALPSQSLANDRFFTPAQENSFTSVPINKSQSRRHRSRHGSLSASPSTHNTTMSSSSYHSIVTPEKRSKSSGTGIGISPAPKKTSSSRIIVPYVSPSDSKSKHLYTMFALLIQPTQKIFELIRINYNPANATLRDLLKMIPDNCTGEELCEQSYIGFCRPNGSSSSNSKLTNLTLTASVMARDGSCARIVCGEVLAAIPKGFTSKETQIMARHILKNPKMMKLLSKTNPLSKKRSSSDASVSSKHSKGGSTHLGIQPSNNYYASENTGTFSSSVLFAPLTNAIAEDEAESKGTRQNSKGNFSSREGNLISGDVSCCSSLSTAYTINSLRSLRSGKLNQSVSNTELKNKLQHLECTVKNLTKAAKKSKKRVTPVNGNGDNESTNSKFTTGLSASQLDEIKREATEAARAAAEEAFAKRMEELVDGLDVSDEEKNQLLENDDMSYHSTMSFTMNAASSPLFANQNCDFPTNGVSITQYPRPPSEVRFMAPHGSFGAYASEVKVPSPYTPASELTLLTPIAPMPNARMFSPLPPFSPYSPESSTYTSPTPIDPVKNSSYEPSKIHGSVNKTVDTTFTENSVEYNDEELEASLILETMEGFYDVAMKAANKFNHKKNKKISEIQNKISKRKLHLTLMSAACMLFLSSQSLAGLCVHNMNINGKVLNRQLEYKTNTSSTPSPDSRPYGPYEECFKEKEEEEHPSRSFGLYDLQQVLFWFLLIAKGQDIRRNMPHRQRRKRRAWKSRVIPVR